MKKDLEKNDGVSWLVRTSFWQNIAKALILLIVIQAGPLWDLSQSYEWNSEKFFKNLYHTISLLGPGEARADVGTIFGPQEYIRTTGKPNVYQGTFSSTAETAQLIIFNGEEDARKRVSSAIVSVNGIQIFGPMDFDQNIDLLVKSIDVSQTNTVRVELRSKPGSYLLIEITENGVLLEGPPDAPAMSALRDVDFISGVPANEIEIDAIGREVARTELLLKLAANTTVRDVNVVLTGFGARITAMITKVPYLLVRVPDPGTLAGLEALIGELQATTVFEQVLRAYFPALDALPKKLQFGNTQPVSCDRPPSRDQCPCGLECARRPARQGTAHAFDCGPLWGWTSAASAVCSGGQPGRLQFYDIRRWPWLSRAWHRGRRLRGGEPDRPVSFAGRFAVASQRGRYVPSCPPYTFWQTELS